MIALAVVSSLLAACPDADPEWATTSEIQRLYRQIDCERVGRQPAYFGRLHQDARRIEVGVGHAVALRDGGMFSGPSVRVARTVGGFFFAVEGAALWALHSPRGVNFVWNSQSGGLRVGVPLHLGAWLIRPSAAVGATRTAGAVLYGYEGVRSSIAGNTGAELLVPSRVAGLAIDAGFAQPIIARFRDVGRFDRSWETRPIAQLGAVLTWYFL